MNRLRELRDARGMKQLELAMLLNVSQQAISRYEKNERDMSTDLLIRACEIFGCTADYLLCQSTQMHQQISDDDAQILEAYKRAPDSIRAGIDMLLEPYKTKKEAEGL